MRKISTIVLLLLILLSTSMFIAALTIINVTEYHIRANSPFLKKIKGEDCGNPTYNVKRVETWWSEENGYNVTYVEIAVPRCHKARFYPALFFKTQESVDSKIILESLSGSYTSSLSMKIYINNTQQIEITGGTVIQDSGSYFNVPANKRGDFNIEIFVSSSAPLGVEVARLYTWLEYVYGRVVIKQKIVWIIRTFSHPPVVTLFMDDFEDGDLTGWLTTTYVYDIEKTEDLEVYDNCNEYPPPTPNPIIDATLPISGTRMMMIGHRDLSCEPLGFGNDYARLNLYVPSYIDNVEVRYLRVILNWRLLTWDSQNYDYLNISLSRVGGSTYYIISFYNPNPSDNYGPFADTGWQNIEEYFANIAGSNVRLEILLHTFYDTWYKSWVYIDDVQMQIYFDCVSSPNILDVQKIVSTKTSLPQKKPSRMPRKRG